MTNEKLIEAAGGLRGEVQKMREEFTKSKALVRRLKILTYVLIGFVILFIGFVGYYYDRHQDVVQANSHTLYVNCVNANESRDANRAINQFWLTLWVQGVELTPRQLQWTQDFGKYIDDVYKPRDCHNLQKRYPLPEPPQLG
jgi:hypothetical protein